MNVDVALQQREQKGDPIRIAMIGAGAMGRAIALQLGTPVPGMRLVGHCQPDSGHRRTGIPRSRNQRMGAREFRARGGGGHQSANAGVDRRSVRAYRLQCHRSGGRSHRHGRDRGPGDAACPRPRQACGPGQCRTGRAAGSISQGQSGLGRSGDYAYRRRRTGRCHDPAALPPRHGTALRRRGQHQGHG